MPIAICCLDMTGVHIRNGIGIALTNRTENIYLVSDDDIVDVGILDIDKIPEKEWGPLVSEKSYPVITLSSEKKPYASNHLTKPVRFSELVELICKLSGYTSNTESAKYAIIAADNIKSSRKEKRVLKTRHSNHYNPDKYITGFLSNILKQEVSKPTYTLFTWSKDKWSIVDSKNRRIISNTNRWTLQHLTVTPLEKLDHQKISAHQSSLYAKTATSNDSIEDILCFLGPYLSGKSLPDAVHINQRYRLSTWPNLTQCALSNNDLVIATYWTENTASIAELATFFKLHIQELAPFVNYCYLCHFLTPCSENSVEVFDIASARDTGNNKHNRQVTGNVLRLIIDKLTAA
jgi:hypothetical protein